jgi:hypothetical protein
MEIATITFDRRDTQADCNQADLYSLQEFVLVALDRHFGGYALAAAAQEEYRRVKADIEADTNLFGADAALRAGLAAHPEAREWADFEQEAAAGIEPFCFSIRFRSSA